MYRLQWSWDLKMCERCPHFRGWYVPDSMELGPEDVSICEVSWDTRPLRLHTELVFLAIPDVLNMELGERLEFMLFIERVHTLCM